MSKKSSVLLKSTLNIFHPLKGWYMVSLTNDDAAAAGGDDYDNDVINLASEAGDGQR